MSQNLAPIDYLIWFVGAMLEFGIVAMMIYRRSRKIAPLAFAYILFSFLREFILLAICQYFPSSLYAYSYWILQLAGYLLLIVLGVHIAHTVIPSARGLLIFCLSMIGVLIVTQPFVFFGAGWKTLFLVNISHVAAFMRCALFLLAAFHGSRWKWPYRGIASAFGISAACDLVFNALREQSLFMSWDVLSRTSPASSLIYLAIWLYAVAKPEPLSVPDTSLVGSLSSDFKEQVALVTPE